MTDPQKKTHHVWTPYSLASTFGVIAVMLAAYLFLAMRGEQAAPPTAEEAALMATQPFFVIEEWIRDDLLAALRLSLGTQTIVTEIPGLIEITDDGSTVAVDLVRDGVPLARVFALDLPPGASLTDIATTSQANLADLRLSVLPDSFPDGSFSFLTDDQLVNTVLPFHDDTLLIFQSDNENYPVVEQLMQGLVAAGTIANERLKKVSEK